MPSPEELPEDLRALTRRNAIEISDIAFTPDGQLWGIATDGRLFIINQNSGATTLVGMVEADEEDVVEVEVVEEEEVDLILPRQKGVVALQHFLEPK